jgi:hypothetical protein
VSRTTHSETAGREFLLLPIAGALAGFLTICSMHFFGLAAPPDYHPLMGVPFGALIGVSLWVLGKIPLWKAIALTIASVVAYNIALLATLVVVGLFFLPGVAGAFTILTAILFLVFPHRSWGTVGRALAWSTLGGILGQGGWFLGSVVGPVLGYWLARLHLAAAGQPGDIAALASPEYSVHVIWQAGMGFVLAFALRSEQERTSPLLERSVPQKSLSVAAVLFFGTAFVHAAFVEVWVPHDRSRRQNGLAACITSAPATENLPPHEAASYRLDPELINNAIINRNIGAYVFREVNTKRSSGLQFPEEGLTHRIPPTVNYFVVYERKDVTRYDTGAAAAWIQITEYPNSDWARYELETNKPEFCAAGLYSYMLKDVKKVTRFGQTVLRFSRGRARQWDFYWTDENRLIELRYNFSGADKGDELLEAYLKKYPSSLKP